MYGETFYGRHTAQHQLQWMQIKQKKWVPLRAMKTIIRKKMDHTMYFRLIKPQAQIRRPKFGNGHVQLIWLEKSNSHIWVNKDLYFDIL